MNFLTAGWEKLVMVNYTVDTEVLAPYLPRGCIFDLYGDKSYVSLVGFVFTKTHVFGIPVPLMGTFEEINLRFYVKRIVGSETRRGVVFIKEIVPHRIVSWMANSLYHENYIAMPTRHSWEMKDRFEVGYYWKPGAEWDYIRVEADPHKKSIVKESPEEFIFEHYYGYTKTPKGETTEYRVEHPRWDIYTVQHTEIKCDFKKICGDRFAFLANETPVSVFLAEGSAIAVRWKRENI